MPSITTHCCAGWFLWQTSLMQILRIAAASAAVLMMIEGLAAPAAWADDPNGAYIITWSDGTPPSTWTFAPCGDGCLTVTGNKGWKTHAHLVDGQWVIDPVRNTVHCGNGTNEHATAKGTFDPNTLAGTSVITYPAPCPGDPKGGVTIQFTLAPAPPPPADPNAPNT